MNIRPLVIDDNARAEARRVLDYATSHPYQVGNPTPGDNPCYTAHFNTYRAVFTYTHVGRKVYRHLTVSVPSEKYPSPIAAYSIAVLFGFIGWNGTSYGMPDGWQGVVNEKDHCIVLAQEIFESGNMH